MSAGLLFVEGDDDFLEQGAQQFLLVARRRGRCLPGLEQIGAEGKQADALVCAERSWAQLFATRKLGLGLVELAQAVLPLGLDAAGDEAVVGVDSAIATLGALRLVACALDRETPLRQRAVVVGFDALGRGERGLDAERRERSKHGVRHRLVDLHGADAEAVDAAAVDDALAGAVIARRRGAAGVVCAQLASALSADGQPLQQSASFSHGTAAGLMRSRMSVGSDPRTIALVRAPIDEAFVVVRKEHGPLRSRQLAYALLARAGGIESDLMAALAIRVGARVDRIRQHMIDGDVAGVDPAHAAAIAGVDRAADGLIRMEAHVAILFAPDEAHGEAPAQFAARRLVADAAEQART